MAKILLVSGAVSGSRRYGKLEKVGAYLSPYGLMSIAACLEKAGHQVLLVDREVDPVDDAGIVALIARENVDMVGLSVFTIGAEDAILLAQAIKAAHSLPLIIGGPHVFVGSEFMTRHTCFDYMVVGEGEVTIVELADAIANKKDVAGISGILYRDGDQWITNPAREPIQNLDDIPYPAFHLLQDIGRYHPSPFSYRRTPHMSVVTSRGCPFNCVFCSAIWGHKWRSHSAEYVLGLVDLLVRKYGVKEIWFAEDTFALNRQRVLDICQGIIKAGYDLTWACMTNAHVLDREMAKLMKRAGCWQIQLGLESGDDDVLAFIGKPVRTKTIREKVTMLDEEGIKVRGYFILGNLVDTVETMHRTVEFAKSLPLFTAEFHILHLPLGSRAREIAHEYGTVNYDLSLLTGYTESGLSFLPKNVTEEQMFTLRRKAHNQFFLRPRQLLRILSDIKNLDDVKRYLSVAQAFFITNTN